MIGFLEPEVAVTVGGYGFFMVRKRRPQSLEAGDWCLMAVIGIIAVAVCSI